MNNNQTKKQSEERLYPLYPKEIHLVKILRSILFGEVSISKQNGNFTIATVSQKIKLNEDDKYHVVANDVRNVGTDTSNLED